ncbi:MAG: hypothetical protein ACK2UT_08895 [Candidatus Promineifilaceae bacterium]
MSEARHSRPVTDTGTINKPDGLRWVLFGVALLAFALRLYQLDAQSIWWDEGISLHLATSDLLALFRDRLDNIHPPLYFVLLKGWLLLSGVTVFTARYLSVLAGWLLVPAAYGVAARWFSRRTGLIAAVLAAVSAVSVIYSQEIRVYSLLPLVYLALLAITQELTRLSDHVCARHWLLWAALGVASWTAMHLHYVAFFTVAYVTVWALISFARSRRWLDLRRLLLVQFLAALASLPWFASAFYNWSAIRIEASAGTFSTDPVPLRYLLAQVWAFHLSGLAGALGRTGVGYAVGATALLLVLLLAVRLYDRQTRRQTAVLLAHWLIPLSLALLVWLVRSFSHPRYVAMFVPGLILLAAYLIWPGVPREKPKSANAISRSLALLLFIALTGLSLWGLAVYFFDEDAAKDDIRGAARYLEEAGGAGDLIVVPDSDWSLPFEYRGEADVVMPGLANGDEQWDNLAAMLPASGRVFTLDYARGTRDWQGLLPFALHKAGEQISSQEIDDLVVRGYQLDETLSPPEFTPLSVQFGPLLLGGVWFEQGTPAGDALPLALQWRVDAAEVPALNVALRLEDENGRVLTVADDRLVDEDGRPSDQWRQGQVVSTYHLLDLPPATPPLQYTLAIEVYAEDSDGLQPVDLLDEQGAPRGRTFTLTGVETARASQPSALERVTLANSLLPSEVSLAPGLVLQDASLSARSITAGVPLRVELLWRAEHPLPDLRPRLLLIQDDAVLAENGTAPANGRYPTSLWQKGEQVLEERILEPAAGRAGLAQIMLELGDRRITLGQVDIETQQHSFDRPSVAFELQEQFADVALLAGFDLPETVYSTAETVPLTLVWQSLAGAPGNSYSVFTHLLGENGRLIAQHDSIPAGGERPLSGWVEGEYILDRHEMVFRDVAYSGPAQIEVGFYDPASGERVRLADGSDHLILPVELTIAAGQ